MDVGDNHATPESWNLYPNPTNGYSTLDLGAYYETVKVKVLNYLGQTIANDLFKNKQQIPIEISGAKGIYFLEIEVDNSFSKTIKLSYSTTK